MKLKKRVSTLRRNYINFNMLTVLSFLNIISNDLAQPWELGFQDGASPGFTGIVDLHNTIFFYLVVISIGVFWVLGSILYFYRNTNSLIIHKYLNHGTLKCLHAYTPKIGIKKINDGGPSNLIAFGRYGLLKQSYFRRAPPRSEKTKLLTYFIRLNEISKILVVL